MEVPSWKFQVSRRSRRREEAVDGEFPGPGFQFPASLPRHLVNYPASWDLMTQRTLAGLSSVGTPPLSDRNDWICLLNSSRE